MAAAALGLTAWLAAGGPAGAVERLNGPQIRAAFEGNTVSGRYGASNQPFSEHHHGDGRASGHNRNRPNTDACWTTVSDGICYYYGPVERRRTYCFDVDLTGSLYVLRSRPSGRINALATVQPGDPNGFADSGRAWTCDGLVSQAPGTSRRLAAR